MYCMHSNIKIMYTKVKKNHKAIKIKISNQGLSNE